MEKEKTSAKTGGVFTVALWLGEGYKAQHSKICGRFVYDLGKKRTELYASAIDVKGKILTYGKLFKALDADGVAKQVAEAYKAVTKVEGDVVLVQYWKPKTEKQETKS